MMTPRIEKLLKVGQMCDLGRETIRDSVPENGTYMEWGSGGTTLWLLSELSKKNARMISVEHSTQWHTELKQAVDEDMPYEWWEYHLKPRPELPVLVSLRNAEDREQTVVIDGAKEFYISTPKEELPAGLADYIRPPGVDLSSVNTFLVDGLARGACLAMLYNFAHPSATIFFHDIDKREDWYEWAISIWRDTGATIDYVYHNMLRITRTA